MKTAILRKAAITSVALLTLAGGAGSAFAHGNDKGHGNQDNDNQGKKIKTNMRSTFSSKTRRI
ncbi:hypothetical protein [Paenibacillus albus]|uniref:hypothetical protein n=1 Tax=Paenibacillus albus TaxID=2495582 RepID=UPI001D1313E0|nr:hypothetical protein [Paenibacillus albus]